MADQLALSLEATPPGTYRQRGVSSLQRLFRAHVPELLARYEEFAKRLGKLRLERITKAVERFLARGGYSRGLARIACTNPDCKAEYFRPFSCKVFHLCPSCSQKRTLLFGEYMNERLLLRLPRQMVFTFPKLLRVFFRHDRRLYGEISKLVYRMIQRFYTEAAGRTVQSAAVIARVYEVDPLALRSLWLDDEGFRSLAPPLLTPRAPPSVCRPPQPVHGYRHRRFFTRPPSPSVSPSSQQPRPGPAGPRRLPDHLVPARHQLRHLHRGERAVDGLELVVPVLAHGAVLVLAFGRTLSLPIAAGQRGIATFLLGPSAGRP